MQIPADDRSQFFGSSSGSGPETKSRCRPASNMPFVEIQVFFSLKDIQLYWSYERTRMSLHASYRCGWCLFAVFQCLSPDTTPYVSKFEEVRVWENIVRSYVKRSILDQQENGTKCRFMLMLQMPPTDQIALECYCVVLYYTYWLSISYPQCCRHH